MEGMNLVMELTVMDMAPVIEHIPQEELQAPIDPQELQEQAPTDLPLVDPILLLANKDHQDQDKEEDQTQDLDHHLVQGPHDQDKDNVPHLDHLKTMVMITMVLTTDHHDPDDMEAVNPHLIQAIHLTQATHLTQAAMEDIHPTIPMTTKTHITDMILLTLLLIMLTLLTVLDQNWSPTKALLQEAITLIQLHTAHTIANQDTLTVVHTEDLIPKATVMVSLCTEGTLDHYLHTPHLRMPQQLDTPQQLHMLHQPHTLPQLHMPHQHTPQHTLHQHTLHILRLPIPCLRTPLRVTDTQHPHTARMDTQALDMD